MIRVFGLHDAVKHAEATMLQRIKLSCSAQDDPMSVTAHSDWGGASGFGFQPISDCHVARNAHSGRD